MEILDPYQRPPDNFRNVYKKYQKMKLGDLTRDDEILDLENLSADHKSKVLVTETLDPKILESSFQRFSNSQGTKCANPPVPIYEHKDIAGLRIIPNLLPPDLQLLLLSRLLHRDLSNPSHLTNIHTHYNVSYPPSNSSFFSHLPSSSELIATPLDPSIHKPLTSSQLLTKKLRWMTLGGQYDWTAKRYPESLPPVFPADIKELLESIFNDTKAEAAIVNLYSPGDTLSLHRDVAESSATGLISISLGCDAVFIIGTASSEDGGEKILTVRLKSGSAVYMSGTSRFAWHGVPQIVPDTCPEYLKDWPAAKDGEDRKFEHWRYWMAGKRVNLNVRQMWG